MFDLTDDYSLLGICEWLDFADLANIAVLNPRLHHLVERYFITSKYEDAEIVITVTTKDNETQIYQGKTGRKKRFSQLATGHTAMFSALEAFCHMFGHISITMYDVYDINLIQEIANSVNSYCSNPTKVIGMTLNQKIVDFKFENVTMVKLKKLDRKNADAFNDCFPGMEGLQIDIKQDLTIDSLLPTLKHFELKQNNFGEFNMTTFAEKNPQITSLTVEYPWMPHQLQQLDEIFPNLKSLHIHALPDEYIPEKKKETKTIWTRFKSMFGANNKQPEPKPLNTIQFRNVKKFDLDLDDLYTISQRRPGYDVWVENRLPKIQFDHLTSFRLKTRHSSFSVPGQIDLILKNTELTDVEFVYRLTYDQMVQFVDGLPKLKSFAVHCQFQQTVDDILRFMAMETNLDTMNIYVCSEFDRQFKEMSTMPGDWYLYTIVGSKRFVYKRKSANFKQVDVVQSSYIDEEEDEL